MRKLTLGKDLDKLNLGLSSVYNLGSVSKLLLLLNSPIGELLVPLLPLVYHLLGLCNLGNKLVMHLDLLVNLLL